MCNLYSMTKSQAEIGKLASALRDHVGNLPLLPKVGQPHYPTRCSCGAAG